MVLSASSPPRAPRGRARINTAESDKRSWEALFRDQNTLPTNISHVLVLGGAGAVGSLATQFLEAKTPSFVISTASRPDSKGWCKLMGADLVQDHSLDIPKQLRAAGLPSVDWILSTAKTSENIGWITSILRPYGHLSVVDAGAPPDVSALMMKSASLHTEMVFSRIISGGNPERQGEILETVVHLVESGQIRPIANTVLNGFSVENMLVAHETLETGHTIAKLL